MEKFIEQKMCQEIDILTMQLLSVLDENQEKLASFGRQNKKRIVQNALFNFMINLYQPVGKSPLAAQNYPRYAEQIRKDFNKIIHVLSEFKPGKIYK